MIKRFVCFVAALAFSGAVFAQAPMALTLTHNANTVRYASQDRVSQYFLDKEFNCNTGCDSFGLTGKKVWTNWITSGSEIDDWGTNLKVNTNGVQVGSDIYSNKTTLIGLVGGYEASDYEVNGFDPSTDGKDYYFGIYGAKLFSNCVDMRLYGGYGTQRFGTVIFPDDTMTGKTFETTIEFGRRYHLNRCWSYRPFVGLDWFSNNVQANGTNNYELTQVMGRIGSDLQYTRGRWNLNGGLHYAYQLNESALANAVTPAIELGRKALTLTAGTTVYLDKCQKCSLFVNYYGDYYMDRHDSIDRGNHPWRHTGLIGAGYRF